MLQRLKRKRGGQPGNKNSLGHQNALRHGRYSPRIKAERLADRRAREAEARARFQAWVAPRRATFFAAGTATSRKASSSTIGPTS